MPLQDGNVVSKRVDVASALIFDDSRENIIMVRNKNGDSSYWSLPGGAVEPGETLEQAVKRETKEESGLKVEIIGLYSVREVFFSGAGHHALIFTFEAKIIEGELNTEDPDDEILEVRWTDIKTANEILAGLPIKLTINSEDKSLSSYSFYGKV